jgi:hypothetical protein
VPESFEEYLKGKRRAGLRLRRNRALRLGYRFQQIDPRERLAEIVDLNRSLSERQGRPMETAYLDATRVLDYFGERRDCFAVLDADGRLRAYADVPVIGEVAVVSRLLGHGEALPRSVVYLCLSEVIRELSERRRRLGTPCWLFYDTLFGGSEGLRYFKTRFGFRPHHVKWLWAEPPEGLP